MADPCICCGCEMPPEWGSLCDTCEDLAIQAEGVDSWLVGLGLSIRRFVRRAEVEGLVADVRHETLRHDYHCNNRRSGCGCRGDRAQSALDRLAALALGEGHGDG